MFSFLPQEDKTLLAKVFSKFKDQVNLIFQKLTSNFRNKPFKKHAYLAVSAIDIILITLLTFNGLYNAEQFVQPLISPLTPLHPLTETKSTKEVFGFAPHWTFNKLDNVDFETLTTLAYFGVTANADGSLDKSDPGYQTFKSSKATTVFKKAHSYGTKVVLTITQMKNGPILALMDDPIAQDRLIKETVNEVEARGIDGINVDFEYSGNPGQAYREKFTNFIAKLTTEAKARNPKSSISVSVYASAVKEPKIYDITALGQQDIRIFMMAYDFAVAGSDNAIPTSPLYGHDSGKYWYDVSTAVNDFIKKMPAEKLILGVPWYGYNYLVYEPKVKAETKRYSWQGSPKAQTYSIVSADIKADMDGVDQYQEGWDEEGKVAYKAYHLTSTNTWRMVFLDDTRSLNEKYDFAKSKHLAGVGMWALGFDDGHTELWAQLREEFGTKLADNTLVQRVIAAEEN